MAGKALPDPTDALIRVLLGEEVEWEPSEQPLTEGDGDASELRRADGGDAGGGAGAGDPDLRPGDLEVETHFWNEDHLVTPEQLKADGTCPTCLRPLPHTREQPREGKRPRRTWSITVPKDERENGAETLDTLLEEARKEMARAGLPYGDEDAVKFFILSAVLGLFVTHAQDVLS